MPKRFLPFEKRKPKVFVKRASETNPELGCRPEERPAEQLIQYGIVNLNKPQGPTSHQVSECVKKILGAKKAGHAGTLDPAVTGVLPVALGRSTRIVQALLNAGKEYVGTMHLHGLSETKDVEKTAKEFVGRIKQMVPRKAAVKRTLREREIYYFDILEIEGKEVLFRVGCEAGTYVRKLCHDFGKALKIGAHLSQLHRTKAGPFTDENYVTLQDLQDAVWYWKNEKNQKLLRHCVRPVEQGVQHLPKAWIVDNAVDPVCHGASVKVPGIGKLDDDIAKNKTVAVMTLKNELVALGVAQMSAEEILSAQRGIAVKPSKVFMMPGTYKKQARVF